VTVAIDVIDVSESGFKDADAEWAYQVLVVTREWLPELTYHAVSAADDLIPPQDNRAVVLLQAAERIGRAVQDIEDARKYVPCPTTTT